MALVIGERLATLRELQDWYSYEDALNMAEVIMVRSNNEAAAMKAAEKR